jgi:hypothetical protein
MARWSGLPRAELLRYLELEVITVADRAAPAGLVRRLRRIRRLRRDLGLSVDAVAIILRLLDRIEALEAAGSVRSGSGRGPGARA